MQTFVLYLLKNRISQKPSSFGSWFANMDSCMNTTDILLPLFNPRKRVTANQLKKALNMFGYKTWCSFLPGKLKIEWYQAQISSNIISSLSLLLNIYSWLIDWFNHFIETLADKENIEGYAREKLNKKFFQIMLGK